MACRRGEKGGHLWKYSLYDPVLRETKREREEKKKKKINDEQRFAEGVGQCNYGHIPDSE